MKKIIFSLISVILTLSFLLSITPVYGATYEYTTWKQSDSRWGSITFGNVGDTVSKSGCAVTSIAILMVHSGAVSTDPTVFNPGIFVNWLKKNNGFTSQGWLYWGAVNGYTSKFTYYSKVNLSSSMSKSDKIEEIEYYINKGYCVVVEVNNGGHYVAIDRVSNGVAYMFDPANRGYDDLFDYSASGVVSLQLYKGPKASILSGGSTTTTPPNFTPGKMGTGTYVITSDNGLNIRSGAGTTYSVLGAIPYNTSIYVSDVSNNWGKITYGGVTGWISLQYAKMTAPDYIQLKVTPPTKTEYKTGETLNTAGMTVTAVYSNNTTKVITSGYTVSGYTDAVGTHTITVAYNGRGATFTVSVTQKESQTVYETGRYRINTENGVNIRKSPNSGADILKAIPNGTEVSVTQISGAWGYTTYDGQSGWISLEYTEKIAEAVVPTLTGITLTPPAKTVYTEGEQLSTAGMVVTAKYSDNSSKTISSGYTVTGYSSSKGTHTVTVTYEGKTATFSVTVNAAPVTYQLGTYRILSDDGMNVRKSPSTDAGILGAVPYNTVFTVSQISGEWGYTTVDGITGWINLKFSELISSAEKFSVEIEVLRANFVINNAIPSSAFKVYKVEDGVKTETTDYTLDEYDNTTSGVKNIKVTVGTKTATLTVKYFDKIPTGDSDFDGSITAVDALMILHYVVGKVDETVIHKESSDVDKNGTINAVDALQVLHCVVGKLTFE